MDTLDIRLHSDSLLARKYTRHYISVLAYC